MRPLSRCQPPAGRTTAAMAATTTVAANTATTAAKSITITDITPRRLSWPRR
ncbi:MAG TPA: hypothetical protein VGF45_18645 [Polyangia bacterium]